MPDPQVAQYLVDGVNNPKPGFRDYLSAMEVVSPKDPEFHAVGDGTANDTDPLQAAIARAGERTLTYTPSGSGMVGAPAVIWIPEGHYTIDEALTFLTTGLSYVRILSDGRAIIRQTDATKDIFDFRGTVRIEIEGIIFVGGKRHVLFGNNNVNGSQLTVSRCEFHNSADWAVETTLTGSWGTQTNLSMNLLIHENCLFSNCNRILKNCEGVNAKVKDSWVQLEGTTMVNGAAFENRNALVFDNMYGIPPSASMPLNAHWVDNYGQFRAKNETRFGGENAGMPVVYNYAGPQGAYPYNLGGVVSIKDCFCALGSTAGGRAKGLVIFKTHLPQLLHIEGNYGLTPEGDQVIIDEISGGLQAYIDALGANLLCYVSIGGNVSHVPFDASNMPAALLTNPRKVRYNSTAGLQVVSPIPGPGSSLFLMHYNAGTSQIYRITAGQEGINNLALMLRDVTNSRDLLALLSESLVPDQFTAMGVLVHDGATFEVRHVSMGADDSAGAGFKTLRVAN